MQEETVPGEGGGRRPEVIDFLEEEQRPGLLGLERGAFRTLVQRFCELTGLPVPEVGPFPLKETGCRLPDGDQKKQILAKQKTDDNGPGMASGLAGEASGASEARASGLACEAAGSRPSESGKVTPILAGNISGLTPKKCREWPWSAQMFPRGTL